MIKLFFRQGNSKYKIKDISCFWWEGRVIKPTRHTQGINNVLDLRLESRVINVHFIIFFISLHN